MCPSPVRAGGTRVDVERCEEHGSARAKLGCMTEHPVPDGETSGPPTSSAAGTGTRLDRWLGSYAERTHGMRSSEIRALFAVANRPEVVSLAGGMPFLEGLPLDILGDAGPARRRHPRPAGAAVRLRPGRRDAARADPRRHGARGHRRAPRRRRRHHRLAAGARPGDPHLHRPGRRRRRGGAVLRRRARGVPGLPGRRRARPDRRRRPDPGRARVDPRRARPRGTPGQVPLHRAQLPQPRRRLALR